MAGSSSLSPIDVLRKLQSLGFCLDLNTVDRSKEDLSSLLFDRILSLFLKEIHLRREIRPIPPLLGDGRSVDPFELYRVVSNSGGYDSVSKRHSWGSVAEETGLDPMMGSSLKLIYGKYLVLLDRCMKGEVAGSEAEKVCNPVLETPNQKKRDHFLTPVRANGRQSNGGETLSNGCKAEIFPVLERISAPAGGFSSLKRKREALGGIVKWVKRVAKNPNDPSIGKLSTHRLNYEAHANSEIFSLVLLARRAMYIKKIRNNINEPLWKEDQEAFPSFDADGANKSRFNQGTEFANKLSDSDSLKTSTPSEHNKFKDPMADQERIEILLGPSFQAEVPDWVGKRDETSPKWLGTRIWPPLDQNSEPQTGPNHNPIGRGRARSCQCPRPGSVECTRFHVVEKRLQLKRELGTAFYSWRFNLMGEEASLSWTEEEERKFRAVVSLNRSTQLRGLWDQLHASFPNRGRRDILSYYFNVFLIARRSYQNRVTPSRIDSDDEGSGFGFLGSRFGHDAVTNCDPEPIFCARNAQCQNIDD